MCEFQFPDEYLYHTITDEDVASLPALPSDANERSPHQEAADNREVMSICIRRNSLRRGLGLDVADLDLDRLGRLSRSFRFIDSHMADLRRRRRIHYGSGDSATSRSPVDISNERANSARWSRAYANKAAFVRSMRRLIETGSDYLPALYEVDASVTEADKVVARARRVAEVCAHYQALPNQYGVEQYRGSMDDSERSTYYRREVEMRTFMTEYIDKKRTSSIPRISRQTALQLHRNANITMAITLIQRYAMFSPDCDSFIRYLQGHTDLDKCTCHEVALSVSAYYNVWKH